MRPIDADTLLKKAQALLTFDGAEVIWAHDVMVAPTIDPIRAAGGCRCGECRHSSYDAEHNKRWCNHGSGCCEVKADGSGFCDLGAPREAQNDG